MVYSIGYIKTDEASGFKRDANVEVPESVFKCLASRDQP